MKIRERKISSFGFLIALKLICWLHEMSQIKSHDLLSRPVCDTGIKIIEIWWILPNVWLQWVYKPSCKNLGSHHLSLYLWNKMNDLGRGLKSEQAKIIVCFKEESDHIEVRWYYICEVILYYNMSPICFVSYREKIIVLGWLWRQFLTGSIPQLLANTQGRGEMLYSPGM